MYCCTCAALLPHDVPREKDGYRAASDRQLPCCDRVVCGACLARNSRFATYCPYCQVAQPAWSEEKQTARDVLPPGLKSQKAPQYSAASASAEEASPPRYSVSTSTPTEEAPPPYAPHGAAPVAAPPEKTIVHYLDHARDSVVSLSLAYGVPADTIRRANNLTADYLLQARRVVQIPGARAATSLSPHPVEDEAETRRKAAVRRFMVACKVADYDVATLYLSQARPPDSDHYDVATAVRAYEQDMAWERAHPVEARKMGKRTGGRGGLFRRW